MTSRQSNFPDITRKLRNLNVHDKKKTKRLSLTDSEASDNAPPTSQPSRSRGVGGGVITNWKGESTRESTHHRALQEIRSSLEPYAASDISAESVHSLALELNVDQTMAENVAKSSATLEIARDKLIQILTKKMRDEQQFQMANNNNNSATLRLQGYPNDYKVEYHVPQHNMYHQPRDPHTRTHRGSPDGASLRAESPVGPYNHNGLPHNKIIQVNSLRHKIAATDYELLPRKTQLDPTKVTRQYITPATDPPAYPGNQAPYMNSLPYSRRSSTSDNGNEINPRTTAHHNSLPRPNHLMTNPSVVSETQYRRGQTPPPNLSYDRSMGANTSVSAGIMPGHVQQMVQRMSPSGPPQDSVNYFRPVNTRSSNSRPQQQNTPQLTPSAIMQENHKPIIKGSSTTSLANQAGAHYTPNHPPPSYTVAQQFKNKQKELAQPTYPQSNNENISAYHMDVSRQQPPKMNIHAGSRVNPAQQWSNPINGALMGDINYASYPHPSMSGHSSSPQSSMSSGYQIVGEPCDAHYQTLATPTILKPVSSQPVIRPQPMTVEVPMNCENPQLYSQMPQRMIIDSESVQQSQTLSDRNLQYHMNTSMGRYMTDRDPPPYGESLSGSTSLTSSDITMNYRESDSGVMHEDSLQSRKPKVAANYLNAVEPSGTSLSPMGKPPKGTESAVQAARVTGNNSKRQHACSYSAVSAAKQHKAGSISGPSSRESPQPRVEDNMPPPEDPVDSRDKTVSMSPVPVRKNKKKSKLKRSSKREGSYSGSEEEEEEEPERRSTRVKMFSPDAYKFYMEQHIENVFKNCHSRASRRNQLEQEMDRMDLPYQDQYQMRGMLFQKESNYIRLKRGKIDLSMFQILKPLGVGAFGKVFLANRRNTGKLYAIKTLRKREVLTRNQVAHVKAERDILSEADNDWVVKLYYTFQDKEFLYFVMDYIPGGDMMSLLIKKGIFEEPLAQFYTAELTLALESVHKMGFIHRDIKPDNILIDRDGHIKLTDFGLCTGFRWTHDSKYYQRGGHRQQDSMDFSNEWHKYGASPLKTLDRRRIRDANRHIARSLVGTPNYIAPEVLLREGYTQLCDWWSVGVILYEMVVGQPPFNADTPEDTQLKVINWQSVLYFPENARLKRHTKDLIRGLCCEQTSRLGCRGVEQIKQHSYFRSINWSELRRTKPLYVPKIRFAEDTSNFDAPDDMLLHQSQAGTMNNTLLRQGEHAFFEFTFRRFFDEDGRAYSSQHYMPENDMTIDEAAELANSEDYPQSYCQPNGEWPHGASGESGHSNNDKSFYL